MVRNIKQVATYDRVDALDDYKFARIRTEMYFGSRELATEKMIGYNNEGIELKEVSFVPAVYTFWREVLDNAVDEVIGHGHGNTIEVSYDEEKKIFTVSDNGRGIPADLFVTLFTETKSGRNFGDRGNVAGTNGTGAATTCLTSEFFEIETWHNGEHAKQTFREDLKKERLVIGRLSRRSRKDKSGTTITFSPSADVYDDTTLPLDFIKDRCYEIAAAHPKLRFYFNGKRMGGGLTTEQMIFGKGNKPTLIPIRGQMSTGGGKHRVLKGRGSERKADFKSDFYIAPSFEESGEVFHSIVNGIAAYRGGDHIDAFRRNFFKLSLEALRIEARKRKLEKSLDRKDVQEGLLIYNVTSMPAPNFDTQNKQKLVSKDADKIISEGLTLDIVKKIYKQHPDWVQLILDNCERRVGSQGLKDAIRESKKAKKKRVAKLKDANGRDRSKCILFLAEGDSAIEGMNNLRDPQIHGGLPLRGKVMNVNGVNPAKVVKSEPLLDIMNAMGLQIGKKALPSELRYGKLYIATDEDEDGGDITTLIVNFLYTFWPELFEGRKPVVYKFETPFIILKKGNEREYVFGKDYDDFEPSEWKGWDIIRAKGLGRLEQEDWRNMLKTPSLIPITDDGNLNDALDLMFNNDRPDDRKEWLS